LETATMKVGRFWIDFVNLRAETYADTRVPTEVRIGTATEDALRRDLTINSMFYNLKTGQVEDLTARGLTDLAAGVIATPLAPTTTFLDDPLRVLRAVRFAARLRFALDPGLREAASSPAVRAALASKVSRERVGAEVDLMMRSDDPVGAMRLISATLHLAPIVFPLPAPLSPYLAGLAVLSKSHEYLDLSGASRLPPLYCKDGFCELGNGEERMVNEERMIDDVDTRRLLWYAAFLKPIGDLDIAAAKEEEKEEQKAKENQKKKEAKVSGAASKTGGRKFKKERLLWSTMYGSLKRPTRDHANVLLIQQTADAISEVSGNKCPLSKRILPRLHSFLAGASFFLSFFPAPFSLDHTHTQRHPF